MGSIFSVKRLLLLLLGIITLSCSKMEENEITDLYFSNVKGKEITLNEGETFTLKYMVEPMDMLDKLDADWESSNKNVATVRRGKITAVSAGKCVISLSCGGKTASVDVIVNPIPVLSFELPGEINAYLNQPAKVPVTGLVPENGSLSTILWSISDPEVAKYEVRGNALYVTGLKNGEAYLQGQTETAVQSTKIVIKEFVPVKSVTLTLAANTIKHNGSTTVTADVQPKNASLRDVTWTFSPEGLVKFDSATSIVEACGQGGNVTITATTEEGKSATAQLTILPPPLQMNIVAPDPENNKYNFMSPDGSVSAYPKSLQFELECSGQNVDVTKAVWTSADETIATVDNNGLVTGVGHGYTVISVELEGTQKDVTVRSFRASDVQLRVSDYNDSSKDGLSTLSTSKSAVTLTVYDPAFKGDVGPTFNSIAATSSASSFNIEKGYDYFYVSTKTFGSTTLKFTPTYGNPVSMNLTMDVRSLTFIGESGKNYGTVKNGGSITITWVDSDSRAGYATFESIRVYYNVNDSYKPDNPDASTTYTYWWTATGTSSDPFYPYLNSNLNGQYTVTMDDYLPKFTINLKVEKVYV